MICIAAVYFSGWLAKHDTTAFHTHTTLHGQLNTHKPSCMPDISLHKSIHTNRFARRCVCSLQSVGTDETCTCSLHTLARHTLHTAIRLKQSDSSRYIEIGMKTTQQPNTMTLLFLRMLVGEGRQWYKRERTCVLTHIPDVETKAAHLQRWCLCLPTPTGPSNTHSRRPFVCMCCVEALRGQCVYGR